MSARVKVFVSWSGDLSRRVAVLLDRYMPRVLQSLDVFMSSEDIKSGTRWADELARELETSEFGVLCLTPENLQSPWLLFEAGALTKHRTGRACGLLLAGLTERDVTGPLGAFQHKVFAEAGVRKLMTDLNAGLDHPLERTELDATFGLWWPKLRAEYDACIATVSPGGAGTRRRWEEVYRRVVPAVPLPGPVLDQMGDIVEALRKKCWGHVAHALTVGAKVQVRANVFMPDYRSHLRGLAYELFMHPQLRSGMNREAEWDIRFAPREGATGLVFDEGRQRTVRRRDFLLTDRLREVIHPDLRWIVSTPLKDKQHNTLAVLNIDGVGFDLDQAELDALSDLIAKDAKQLGALLDAAPKRVVSIRSATAD